MAISGDMAALVGENGVPAGRVRVIPNWAPGGDALAPGGRENKTFSGSNGDWKGNSWPPTPETSGASTSSGRCWPQPRCCATAPDIVFLFVGAGPQRETLEEQARRLGLANVRFQPPSHKHGSPKACRLPMYIW